ncbi:MAG: adenine-specific DNA-methyltransferase [Puniceicoccales bacterium]|jgi:site-specific DNA-methyltransferase (adenine-specific)|nr:adenine-specific DNA-methyltransferase [Puniceicoccales bacterium]
MNPIIRNVRFSNPSISTFDRVSTDYFSGQYDAAKVGVSQMYLENNFHTVIFGDVLDVLQHRVPDNSIDLIFADPPYNIGKNFNGLKDKWDTDEDYLAWSYRWLDLCVQKLKPNGSLYVMSSTQFMPHFDIYLQKKMTILSRIIWHYDSSGVQAKKYFGSLYEPILFCVKDRDNYTFNASDILVEAKTGAKRKLIDYRKTPPRVYNSEKVPGNVWEFPRVRYRMEEYENHPTQKPIALLERIIKVSSNVGDTVLDPFAGTFTTSFVAQQNGRNSIGIEIQEPYIKIGLRRLNICKEYNGEVLKKELRSFETQQTNGQLPLNL